MPRAPIRVQEKVWKCSKETIPALKSDYASCRQYTTSLPSDRVNGNLEESKSSQTKNAAGANQGFHLEKEEEGPAFCATPNMQQAPPGAQAEESRPFITPLPLNEHLTTTFVAPSPECIYPAFC